MRLRTRPRMSSYSRQDASAVLLENLEDRLLLSFDYALQEAGPIHVARGQDLYVGINFTSSSPSQDAENVWMSTTPPTGVSVGWETNSYFYQVSQASSGAYPALMRISVSSNAAMGAANVVLTGNSDITHVIHSINVPIVVEAMPAELSAPQFNCAPQPIDQTVLSRWESRMTSYGATYSTTQQISGTWNESGTWYYDGERVFYQIADYTGDSSWNTAATAVESVYRPYVLNNDGRIQGYRNFAQGMAMDYERSPIGSQERTDDATGVGDLANNCGPYPPGIYDVSLSRETSYAIESNLMAKRIGLTIDDAKLVRLVDAALGHLDQWTNMKYIVTSESYVQPFMVGLTCNALIEWYQYTVQQHAQNSSFPIDTRVPGAIKTAADWLVGQTGGQYNAWNPTYNCFNYKIHYSGNDVDATEITSVEVDAYTAQLNLLIAPAFGWLYHMYGETNGATYRQWGDTIFNGGTQISLDTGKQFSQNYRMSIDYVQWRTNNPWANDSTAPTVSTYAEKALTSTSQYVTWKTNEAASSVVEYGPTSSYGTSLTNSLLMQNHRQEITGLTQGNTYHYRIKATDSKGNVTYSPDRTFVAGSDTMTVTIAATDRDATENSSDTGTFTFTRSSGTGSLTVNYSISGTAGNGSDYQTIGTSVTFNNGETTKTVTITPQNDSTSESTEFVTLTLAEAGGYDLFGGNTDTVRIFDDDNPVQTVSVSVIDSSAYEDTPGDTATWRITRNSTAGSLTVNYAIGSMCEGMGNNGTQYQVIPTSVTFAPGESTKDIVLTPIDDDFLEGTADVELTLVETPQVNYRLGAPSVGTVYLPTNDSTVNVTVADANASESGDTGAFTINRTCYDGRGATVYYTLTGTATNGTDYTTIPGSVYFAPNEFTKTITVSPIMDGISESDETVILTLTAPAGCDYNIAWGPSSGTVTIANVDPAQTVTVTTIDAVANENVPGDTGVWRIARSSSAGSLTVYYTITSVYEESYGNNGTQYQVIPTSVTFAPGETTKDVVLTPIDDDYLEGSAPVDLTLTSGQYTIGSPSAGTVWLPTNDSVVSVTATDPNASESGDTGTFTITRTCYGNEAVTVYYTLTGTATNGVDYTTIAGSVFFAADEFSKTITVSPIADNVHESDETVTLTFTTPTGCNYDLRWGTPSATVTIANVDPPQTVTVTTIDGSVHENTPGDTGTWRITRDSSVGSLTVYYTITSVYEESYGNNGTQYQQIPTSVTFAPGESYKDVVLTSIDDDYLEGTAPVDLTLTAGSGYTIGSSSMGTVWLWTNDSVVNVAATDATAAESGNNTGTFTISRTCYDNEAVTVYFTLTGTATNGTDYTTVPLSVYFAADEFTKTIVISPIADGLNEPSETVVLTLTTQIGCNYDIRWGLPSDTITILNS